MTSRECAFCTSEEVRSREIVRTNLVRAFPTNMPIVPGHMLVCPIRHVPHFGALRPGERDAIFEVAERIKKALVSLYGAEGFHEAWNEGPVAGQSVPHFHLHIVPRAHGDAGITEYEPRVFLYRPGSRQETEGEELRSVAAEIRMTLEV